MEEENIKSLRNKGNELFRKHDFSGALKIYKNRLLLDDIISMSNAAEALLQLRNFPLAELQSNIAIQKDISHIKSWSRLSRAIAAQGRLAEAHSLISTSPFNESVRTEQHKMCAGSSPNTYYFTEGILIKNVNGVLGAYASRNFRSQDCLLKETSVTPWTKEDVCDDLKAKKLLLFLNTPEGIQDAKKLNGLFPRTYEDVPLQVPSLKTLEARIIKIVTPETSETQIKEWVRLLASIKLNSHDDGCHGFGNFFNHSCQANCEVRGSRNMEVFCNSDILAGEELCIGYLDFSKMLLPVGYRRHIIKLGWGEECYCQRCVEESDPMNWNKFGLSEELVDHTRAEIFYMDWVNNKLGPITDKFDGKLTFESFLQNDKIESFMRNELIDWMGFQWRELFVLDYYHKMIQHIMLAPHFFIIFENRTFVLSKRDKIVRILDRLIFLYRLEMTVCSEGSVCLYRTRTTLICFLTICQNLQISSKYSGFENQKSINTSLKSLMNLNELTESL
jgi:hypothetical protein